MKPHTLESTVRQTLDQLRTAPLTDAQLLARFVEQADQAAFGELVRRHGAMVFRVCQRILGHTQDAEDAFQAVFIVLARKAGALRQGELGGWLHAVAYRVAQKLRRQVARRRTGAAALEQVPQRNDAAPGTADIREVLDAELARLPDKYRVPLVLCYLEGKTIVEAADQLGWKRDTFGTRLLRGRERLRQCLAGRGIGLSLAGLMAAFAQVNASTVPPLAAAVQTGAGEVTAPVLALAQTYLEATARRRVAVVAAVVASLLLLGGAWWIVARNRPPLLVDGSQAQIVLPHASYVFRTAFAPDSQTLYSVGFDGTVQRWNVRTGEALPSSLKDHPFALATSPDGNTLAAGSWYGTVRLWDAPSGRELVTMIDAELAGKEGHLKTRGSERPAADLASSLGTVAVQFSPDGGLLAVGHERDHRIRLYRTETLRNGRHGGQSFRYNGTHTFRFEPMPPIECAYAANAVSVRPDQVLSHEGAVRDMAFAPDGKTLFAAGHGALVAWDVPSGAVKRSLPVTGLSGAGPQVSADGSLLASALDGLVSLWDAGSLRKKDTLDCRQGVVMAIAFSPDSRWLATGGSDGTVKLWDAARRRERVVFKHSIHRMGAVAFAPDGRTLATAGFDKTVKLWELDRFLSGY